MQEARGGWQEILNYFVGWSIRFGTKGGAFNLPGTRKALSAAGSQGTVRNPRAQLLASLDQQAAECSLCEGGVREGVG